MTLEELASLSELIGKNGNLSNFVQLHEVFNYLWVVYGGHYPNWYSGQISLQGQNRTNDVPIFQTHLREIDQMWHVFIYLSSQFLNDECPIKGKLNIDVLFNFHIVAHSEWVPMIATETRTYLF